MNLTGSILVALALAANVWAIAAYVLGVRRDDQRLLASGRGAVGALALLLTGAITVLWAQFLTGDFSNQYVAGHSSSDLPSFYKFSGLWSGNEGSLLLWVWILALYSAIVVYRASRDTQDMIPYVGTVLMAVSLFFTVVLNFVSRPFAQLADVPVEGSGLNPLLQDPGMVIHPPTLYLGYVGFTVPYAFAITALLMRKADDTWIKVTRRWTLLSWLFLSIGIIWGAQWSYTVLGWGGYWAWDPVENGSLLPWLTGTAFLHSVIIQEKRGMLKTWNIALVIITFLLTVFGTFLNRSGVLASVHAFNDHTLGTWFVAFMGIVLAFSIYLLMDRLYLLKEENQFESLISRESSFLVNNLLLVGSSFTVFWGTVFPLISEAVRGVKVTVGPPFYNAVNVPIGIALIFLIGIGPLLPWRKATVRNLIDNFSYPVGAMAAFMAVAAMLGVTKPIALIGFGACVFVLTTIALEFVRGTSARHNMTGEPYIIALWRLMTRNRRRYGGYLVHVAIILMVIGFTGTGAYQQERVFTAKPGQTMQVGNYELTFLGMGETRRGRVDHVYADLKVREGGVDYPYPLRASKEFHPNSPEPMTKVGLKGGFKEDLFVILNAWERDQTASFKIYVNPLVAWIWIGQYVLFIASLFTLWPEPARRVSYALEPERGPIPAPAGD